MAVAELREALAEMPDDATVVASYEAGCCHSEYLAIGLREDGRVEIDCEAFLR